MQVEVRYHAFVKEKLGLASELLHVPDKATAVDVLAAFAKAHPEFSSVQASMRIALDEEISGATAPVLQQSIVDLLPPYGGG